MNSFKIFGEFARYLKHPLILVGFVLFLLFRILDQLLEARVIPILSRDQGYDVVTSLLNYGAAISALVVILGFGLQFFKAHQKADQRKIAHTNAAGLVAGVSPNAEKNVAPSDPTLLKAVDELYPLLKDKAEKVHDYGSKISGSWRRTILLEGKDRMISDAEKFRQDASDIIKEIAAKCEEYEQVNEIYEFRMGDWSFQKDLFQGVNSFIQDVKKLPNDCPEETLDLLDGAGKKLTNAVRVYTDWIRTSQNTLRSLRRSGR